MSFTSVTTCQGITLNWGGTTIGVTRLSVSRSSPSETDVTGISAAWRSDPNFSDRKVVYKELEYGVVDQGEISCDFFGPGTFDQTKLGMKAQLTISGYTPAVSMPAYLTQLSTEVVAGDLIRGSCTFKLSEPHIKRG